MFSGQNSGASLFETTSRYEEAYIVYYFNIEFELRSSTAGAKIFPDFRMDAK